MTVIGPFDQGTLLLVVLSFTRKEQWAVVHSSGREGLWVGCEGFPDSTAAFKDPGRSRGSGDVSTNRLG
jgi:hypothetical protein